MLKTIIDAIQTGLFFGVAALTAILVLFLPVFLVAFVVEKLDRLRYTKERYEEIEMKYYKLVAAYEKLKAER